MTQIYLYGMDVRSHNITSSNCHQKFTKSVDGSIKVSELVCMSWYVGLSGCQGSFWQ